MAAIAVLGGLLVTCRPPEDPKAVCLQKGLSDLAPWRWIEPRLSGALAWHPCTRTRSEGHIVEEVGCPSGNPREARVSISIEGCDETGRKHVKALRILLLRAPRTDEAVEMLESQTATTHPDARLLSDLAAAYQVRAQRTDRPSDLVRSLDAARRAVEENPDLPAARFNLALAQQHLRLPASWGEYHRRDPSSDWGAEAAERQQELESEEARTAATRWPLNRERLPAVVLEGDREAVAQLIGPFPAVAQGYLLEEVLPDWARAMSQGREEEAKRHRAVAEAVASTLERRDPYLADAVRRIAEATGPPRDAATLQSLIEGHRAFGRALLAQRSHEWRVAEDHYEKARDAFARAGSPLRAGADLGLAISLYQKPGEVSLSRVLERLEPLEKEARERGYEHLLGRVLWIRALCLSLQGGPVKSLELYDEAIGSFNRIDDRENLANVRVRKTGLFRFLGESELAWREVFQALPDRHKVVELQSRHHLLGEAAAAALALGHPQIALLYQTQAVELIQEEMRAASLEGRDEEIKGLRLNLAISLRERAAIELHCEKLREAMRDLNEAVRLAEGPSDENIRRLLQARLQEVLGDLTLESDPRTAIAFFRQALHLVPRDEYRSFLATLLFKIAQAHRHLRESLKAERDLAAGIKELRTEEESILSGRPRGQGEALWTAYFSRFQQAYQLLIRLRLEDGRKAEAFEAVETARAIEPLDLMLRHPSTPKVFRRLAAGNESLDLRQIQARLPHGTFLIEYSVLEDQVLIWVIWRDGFEVLTRPVGRRTIARWTRDLQALARERQVEGFEAALAMPFPDLVAAPLSRIRQALRGRGGIERLVFIPDGPLHGLPLAALHEKGKDRYLIHDVPVEIAPSATLYVYALTRDDALSPESDSSVLLVGDPAFDPNLDQTRGVKRLPRAAIEVERIRQLYPPSRVRVLIGEDATVDRFLTLAKTSTVIHFAGHAFVNSRAPFRSFLLFAPSAGRSGLVDVEELLKELELQKTRLVILSSCSSAGGHPIGPEGLAALVRPLVAAGAPAVAGSLWNVGNDSTEELMVQFHRHYAAGEDPAGALRNAQLDLLEREPALRAAISWGPFQVIGHGGPPSP